MIMIMGYGYVMKGWIFTQFRSIFILFHRGNIRYEFQLLSIDLKYVHSLVKNYLEGENLEALHHPPYSIDTAPSAYHLFCSMQLVLSGVRLISAEDLQNWVDNWIVSKDQELFFCEIHSLSKRWAKVISNNGKYFD